ncbi:hypothetical protein AB1Y20_013152 [Prymnesium parvum]|uniref:BD-FAE-like domain-containing protein n=1 Tax=Prymnesium parvum TaxID=97485 RepID=A0AB34IML2_PRYPA
MAAPLHVRRFSTDPPLSRRASIPTVICRAAKHAYRWSTSLRPLILELVFPQVIIGSTHAGRIFFGYGVTWLVMLLRMAFFATALLPGFLQLIYYYVRSHEVVRGVRFGGNARNSLDMYVPSGANKAPVFIFFTGGAWIIGYKAWGALLGKTLCSCGVLVVCPDYRNFPNGRVGDMLVDVDGAIDWVFSHIETYGGDAANVTLGGQSAGAHLAALALVRRCQLSVPTTRGKARVERLSQAAMTDIPDLQHEVGGWWPSQFKACVLISGAFDLVSLSPHMHARGLSTAVMHAIFHVSDDLAAAAASGNNIDADGCPRPNRTTTFDARAVLPKSSLLSEMALDEAARRLRACSPTLLVEHFASSPAASLLGQLPPITLLHGTSDKTCPHAQSECFHANLLRAGVAPDRCVLKLFEGKTHTSPILEDPMSGNDPMLVDLVHAILGRPAEGTTSRPLCPKILVDFARWVGPF